MTVPFEQINHTPSHNVKQGSTKRVLVAQADHPHRVMSAGQAILFVMITLMIGTMLNASSLYTRASTMDPSFARTSTMTVLRPFDLTSRAIGLTSLRQHARKTMDLPRDDKVDTFTFTGTKSPIITPPSTTLPTLTPASKLTVWIIGDSLSITPAESMLASFSTSAFDIQGTEGQVATGLARPDVFNWFTHINDFVAQNHPKLVIATFGANDDQSLFGEGGAIGPFGSPSWRAEYLRRVSSTLDFLASQKVHTLWIEIPPVRDPVRNDRYRVINEITRTAVDAHPATTTYVETAQSFTNPDGSYSDAITINGTPTLLRAPDGIHFTRAGGDVISNLVLKKLRTLYSF